MLPRLAPVGKRYGKCAKKRPNNERGETLMGTVIPIRTIKASDAKIENVVVAIEKMTINANTLTLSIFRQLRERNVINPETYRIRGLPWGTVDCFEGGCSKNHLHVVWQ